MSNGGIRYSNMVPVHDNNTMVPSRRAVGRDICDQWDTGATPLAMAMKLASRASDANRS